MTLYIEDDKKLSNLSLWVQKSIKNKFFVSLELL